MPPQFPRILVVEDERTSLHKLIRTLERWNYESLAATDGQSAWEILEKDSSIRLVITDWMMPAMNGLDLCRKIRETRRRDYVYVIMLTSQSGKAPFLDAMEAGVDDFINKPFDPEELQARIKVGERILGIHTHVQHLENLLPICMYCKKIRDDKNDWEKVEEYISHRTRTEFSHSICPECYTKYAEPMLRELNGEE